MASLEEKSVWSPAPPPRVADRGRTSAAKHPFQLLPHTVGLSAVGVFPTLIRFSDAGVKLWLALSLLHSGFKSGDDCFLSLPWPLWWSGFFKPQTAKAAELKRT